MSTSTVSSGFTSLAKGPCEFWFWLAKSVCPYAGNTISKTFWFRKVAANTEIVKPCIVEKVSIQSDQYSKAREVKSASAKKCCLKIFVSELRQIVMRQVMEKVLGSVMWNKYTRF